MRSIACTIRSLPGLVRPSVAPTTATLAFAALFTGIAASPAPAVEMIKTVFSGGAVATSGGSYSLVATIGEAGVVGQSNGTNHLMTQGFWGGTFRTIATGVPGPLAGPVDVIANGLHANAPNPFADHTEISFGVARAARTRLDIFDVSGRRVRTLVDDVTEPGRHLVRWDGRDASHQSVGSGVYFYRLTVGDWSESRKMLRLQ